MLHVYFPLNAVLSVVADMDDGSAVEVATTGNEGMLGLPLFLGVDQSPLKSFSQVPGDCLQLSAADFRRFLKEEPELVSVLNRFAQALMMQISLCTAYNRAHAIEQRCCRWLLMTQDRVNNQTFQLTQEFLAQMPGVRRAPVGDVAGTRLDAKLIQSTAALSQFSIGGVWKNVPAAATS